MKLLELFSGTKSIGKAFEKRGWEVVSLDISNEFYPTIQSDILTWDHTSYPPGYFDCIWGSPSCVHYSRARTRGGPRDLLGADALMQNTLDIIEYFEPQYFGIGNPRQVAWKQDL